MLISKLFFIGLCLLPFGCIYRPEILGYLAASPAVPIFSVLGMIGIFGFKKSFPLERATQCLYVYGILNSVISFLIFGWSNLSAVKSVSYIFLCAAWFAPLLSIERANLVDLKRGLVVGLLILAAGFLLSDLNQELLPTSLKEVLFSGGYITSLDDRPRGFHAESSHFSANLGRYLFCFFLITEVEKKYSGARLLFFLLFCSIIIFVSGSKGASISIILVIAFSLLSRKFIKYFILLIPMVYFLAINQVESIIFDIENFTSVSTRLAMFITALFALIGNPFGYGYYGFYDVMSHFGAIALEHLSRFDLNMLEFQIIVEELRTVSFKSSLLDFFVIYGVGFFIFIYYIANNIKFSDPRVRAGFIYFIISACSVEGHNSIMFFLGLAILFKYYKKDGKYN